MVSKWNLADRDGLISFQDRVFTSPFPFCKRWSGSIGLFFADGRGEAHISCLLLWPRVPERNRDRQDKEIASLGILAKRFSFFVKKEFSFIQTGEVLSSFILSWSFFSFPFIQTGRCNLKTDIILRLFPLKEAERRKENYRWNKKD